MLLLELHSQLLELPTTPAAPRVAPEEGKGKAAAVPKAKKKTMAGSTPRVVCVARQDEGDWVDLS